MAFFQPLKKDQLLHTAQVSLTELSLIYQFDRVFYGFFGAILGGFISSGLISLISANNKLALLQLNIGVICE